MRVTAWSPLGRLLVVIVSISGRNPRIISARRATKFDLPRGTRPSRFIPLPGEQADICIDGAVGYQLRSIPSNKVLARFQSTLEAWSMIISMIDGGRSPRTLSLDAIDADGTVESISAGPRLEWFARLNNGEPPRYAERATGPRWRVAETTR